MIAEDSDMLSNYTNTVHDGLLKSSNESLRTNETILSNEFNSFYKFWKPSQSII